MISGRRRSVIFFTVLGICLVAFAVTLNISWIVLNWHRAVLVVLGIVLFIPIIAGMVLNTIFLVREIRRLRRVEERMDSLCSVLQHLNAFLERRGLVAQAQRFVEVRAQLERIHPESFGATPPEATPAPRRDAAASLA